MSAERLLTKKGFHVSWDRSTAMPGRSPGGWTQGAEEGGAWRAVVGITRGGLVPAMIVSRELDIRVVDTISVKSYHSGGGAADQRREAQMIKAPNAEMMGDGSGILIVDDLVDSGKTLELIRGLIPRPISPRVYAKPHGKPMVDSYITEVSQDTWIFFHWDMALQYVQPMRGAD